MHLEHMQPTTKMAGGAKIAIYLLCRLVCSLPCLRYIHDLFTVKTSKHHLRNSRIINQPKFKTVRYGINSFMYQGAKLWNTMNNDVKGSDNFKEFIKRINTWYGPTCNCSYCKLYILRRM